MLILPLDLPEFRRERIRKSWVREDTGKMMNTLLMYVYTIYFSYCIFILYNKILLLSRKIILHPGLFEPWGPNSRTSCLLPPLLQRSEIGKRPMTEAIAVELFLMTIAGLLAHLSKGAWIDPLQAFFETLLFVRLLMPPFLIGNASAVAKYIAVPVFCVH
jgi:hypothetical protein